MKLLASSIAINQVGKNAKLIWYEVLAQMSQKYQDVVFRPMDKSKFMAFIYNTRRSQFGTNWVDLIESAPLATVSNNDDRQFLQFNTLIVCEGVTQRFVGWGHPDLLHIAKYQKTHIYIDATFRCVPAGFSQCLIFMIFDAASSVYVPVFYVLMNCKSQWAYWIALNQIIIVTENKLDPRGRSPPYITVR
jgi:hypothetical protein